MSIDASALSLLTAINGGNSSSGLLGVLYRQASSAGTGNPVAALQSALKNETKGVAAAAAEPQAKRDIAAFRAAVAKATDVKTLLSDPTVRKVLLTANGMADMTDYGALATKALMSDTTDSKSLASTLTDTRWKAVAQTYDFAHQGLAVLKQPDVLNRLANGYAEVAWRKSLDASTPGLSKAIDFRTRAATITSADQILGDPVLRAVVTTALGIPKQIAFQTLGAQENAITSRLDLTQFKKPAFVEQFTRRYLVQASTDTASNMSTSSSTGLLV